MGVLKRDYGRVQNWRNNAIADLVAQLTKLGQEACKYAVERRGYTHRKKNLRDSIGSAVYVDGKLVESSKRFAFSKSSTGTYQDRGDGGTGEWIEGRDALNRYWDEHKTLENARNTVELVVVAGVFYSGILEDKGYQVISAATDYLESQMGTYKSYKPKMRAYADQVSFI